jgi:hypothetical protein
MPVVSWADSDDRQRRPDPFEIKGSDIQHRKFPTALGVQATDAGRFISLHTPANKLAAPVGGKI